MYLSNIAHRNGMAAMQNNFYIIICRYTLTKK